MGLGFSDGFKPVDHVIDLTWDADIQKLKQECISSFDDTLDQDVYSHYGKDTYRVITPFGEKGKYPILDKHAEKLENIIGVRVGHSYVVQEPNTYYMHHCDPVATAFFQHSTFDKVNLLEYFKPSDREVTREDSVEFFQNICSYLYEAADDRTDIFLNIEDRLKELKETFNIENDVVLSSEEIKYWKGISPRCSININLEDEAAPVNYVVDGIEIDYNYRIGLLNVDAKHGVKNINNRRLIARFVIYDKTFTEVSNILSNHNYQIN